MTIQYCSDLHLEFPENDKYMRNNPLKPVGDVLVLAGDIVAFAAMHKQKAFFDYIADNFATIYWIPGNHEYYDTDIEQRSGELHEKIRDNIFLINQKAFVQGEIKFIFSTMWSAITEANRGRIENYISDFKAIRGNGKALSTNIFNRLHTDSLDFITQELDKEWPGKTVVVTHHVPTYMHYPKKYKGDVLSEVFAVELEELILQKTPNYWIYGHHHANTPAFNIGSTQLLTNQLGYVHHYEYSSFNGSKHFVL